MFYWIRGFLWNFLKFLVDRSFPFHAVISPLFPSLLISKGWFIFPLSVVYRWQIIVDFSWHGLYFYSMASFASCSSSFRFRWAHSWTSIATSLSVYFRASFASMTILIIPLPICNTLPTFVITGKNQIHDRPLIFLINRGYTLDEYLVETKDGYRLGLHRISSPHLHQDQSTKKPVVLLWHGFMMNSEVWVCHPGGPQHNLAFVLADLGYDVWLGNVRGNKYGCSHLKLKPNQPEFWDFSLDEHALIDLPTTVDYILRMTSTQSLSYIGFSQGTTICFAALSLLPELRSKMNLFVALAPSTQPIGELIFISFDFNHQHSVTMHDSLFSFKYNVPYRIDKFLDFRLCTLLVGGIVLDIWSTRALIFRAFLSRRV